MVTPLALLQQKPYRMDYWLAFGLGSGLTPKAPGTVGTLMGVLCYGGLLKLGFDGYLGVVLVAALMGPWLCQQAVNALGQDDHSAIVWDEMVGFWCTMLWLPTHWLWVLMGFALFRFFDILKPWPIRWLDRHVKGGWGVMLDDLAAALAANLCLQLLLYLTAFD